MPRESASASGGFASAAALATITAEADAASAVAVEGEAPLSLLWSSSDEEGRMYPDDGLPSSIEESGNQTGADLLKGQRHRIEMAQSHWFATNIFPADK